MNFLKNPAFILRFLIALAYIGLGIALFINQSTMLFLSKGLKYAFALLLIAYGSFRGYRAWNQFQNDEL
jgi:hypothetical protein